jgi:hypothetical protein
MRQASRAHVLSILALWLGTGTLPGAEGRAQTYPASVPPAETAAAGTETLEPAVDTSRTGAERPSAAVGRSDAPVKAVQPAPVRRTPAPAARRVLDRVDLEATQITGNRELPRVLYIVPWKRSDLGDLAGKPVNSLLDEVLAPVDRDVFRRETRYFEALQSARPAGDGPDSGNAGTAATAPPSPRGDSVRDASQPPAPGGN